MTPVTPRTWRAHELPDALRSALDELGDEVEIVELSAGENMPIKVTTPELADGHIVGFTELFFDGEGWASWAS
jgi:hypothetical protein